MFCSTQDLLFEKRGGELGIPVKESCVRTWYQVIPRLEMMYQYDILRKRNEKLFQKKKQLNHVPNNHFSLMTTPLAESTQLTGPSHLANTSIQQNKAPCVWPFHSNTVFTENSSVGVDCGLQQRSTEYGFIRVKTKEFFLQVRRNDSKTCGGTWHTFCRMTQPCTIIPEIFFSCLRFYGSVSVRLSNYSWEKHKRKPS